MAIDKPGLYGGIPMAAYLADPCVAPSLSSSIAITLLQQSPFHAWSQHPRHPKPLPRDDSRVASIGTVAHALVLERSEDSVVVLDPHDFTGPRGGVPKGYTNDLIRAARDEAIADGKTPLLLKDMETCRAMRDAMLEYIERCEIADAFKAGEAEMTAVAQEGPIWLRARPDWISADRKTVIHLKTTARSAKPESFIRGLLPSMAYDVALMFYQRVLAGATGIIPERNVILCTEQEPPYCSSLIALDPQYEAIAQSQVERAVRTWAQCMKSGVWPAYPTRIAYAEPKPWMLAEEEEKAIFGLGDYDPKQQAAGFPQA